MHIHVGIIFSFLLFLAGCNATTSGGAGVGISQAVAYASPEISTGPLLRIVHSVSTNERCVALTFDDGPHSSFTPELLDILERAGVKATFFVVGQRAAANPDIIARMLRDGHEIGNHSWSHPNFTAISNEAILSQVERTDAAIAEITGSRPRLVRLPYGAGNTRVYDLIGRPIIFWDVDTLDWQHHSSERVIRVSTSQVGPGSIVLMHDIHYTTVAGVPGVIQGLRAQGFGFLTVSQMLAGRSCRPPQFALLQ